MPSILLVDDDPRVLEVLNGYFDRRQWTVHRSATGQGGVRRYELERPDLVLLDLQLPDLNGIAVLNRIRRFDEDATVIMLTGHA
ncbi:MAG: response regulator transcription factor, partial [Gemmatimonadota bacterium]